MQILPKYIWGTQSRYQIFFLKLKLKSYEQSLIGLTKVYCLANNTVYINYTGIKIFFNVLFGIFSPTIIISVQTFFIMVEKTSQLPIILVHLISNEKKPV